MDHVVVNVEVASGTDFDEVRELEALRRRVGGEIASALAVNLEIKLVEPKSIERSQGKAVRVIDNRASSEGA
jgi:phenylacetate-CoA ligase